MITRLFADEVSDSGPGQVGSRSARAQQARGRRPKAVIAALASLVLLMTGTVMAAWLTGIAPLPGVLPGLASMPFTTALTLALLAISLVGFATNRHGLALGAAGSALLLAAVTGAQYLFGWSFGIDQWLVQAPAMSRAPWPGMAPVTSGALTAVAVAMLLTLKAGCCRAAQTTAAALATASSCISVTALVWCATDPLGDPIWRPLAGMALYTAGATALVSSGVLWALWVATRRLERGLPYWLWAPVTVALGVASLALSHAVEASLVRGRIARTTVEAGLLSAEISAVLNGTAQAYNRLARRTGHGAYSSEQAWRDDVAVYLSDAADPHAAVQMFGRSMHPGPALMAPSATLPATRGLVPSLVEALELGTPVVMVPLETAPGTWSFRLAAPVPGGGGIAVSLSFRSLLDPLLKFSSYAIEVEADGRTVYARGTPAPDAVRIEAPIAVAGATWRARLTPTAALVASERSWLPRMLLAFGLVLSGVVGWSIALARRSAEAARAVRQSSEALKREVAERVAAEESRHRTEQLLHSVLDASTSGIIAARALRDSAGVIEDFEVQLLNPAAERMLGTTSARTVGQRLCGEVCGDNSGDMCRVYASVIKNRTLADLEICHRLQEHDAWLRVIAVPLGDGVAITFEDITLRRRAKDELAHYLHQVEESRDQIRAQSDLLTHQAGELTLARDEALAGAREMETALRMQADFVSFASHQLRTPLAGIKWLLELAQEEPEAQGDLLSYIVDSRLSADRLIGLVNDLLDIARLEGGRTVAAPARVDLAALCRDVTSQVQPNVDQHRHTLTVSGLDEPAEVFVDGAMMLQVIQNLLSNAIKYTPEGGHVCLRLEHRDGEVACLVDDSGIGVPEAARPRLFEKFFRADNVQTMETEGTGLGLFMVRLILQKFGGRIWHEPGPDGAGSRFAFALPIYEESDEPGEADLDRRRRPRAA